VNAESLTLFQPWISRCLPWSSDVDRDPLQQNPG
jgi:hypothetical protein